MFLQDYFHNQIVLLHQNKVQDNHTFEYFCLSLFNFAIYPVDWGHVIHVSGIFSTIFGSSSRLR